MATEASTERQSSWTAVSITWGQPVAAHGALEVPALLLEHQGTVGLSHGDLVCLLHLEALKGAPVTHEMLGARMGLSRRGTEKVVQSLRKRGLIDSHAGRHSPLKGPGNTYRLWGLRQLLALIAANLEAGVPAGQGLDEARTELAARGQ